jgi:hypothetical protein
MHLSHASFSLFVLGALTGCLTSTTVHRAPGAPALAPSKRVELVQAAPSRAPLLATIEGQGNNFAGWSACVDTLQARARSLGATALVVRPRDSALIGAGVACEGDAYGPVAP